MHKVRLLYCTAGSGLFFLGPLEMRRIIAIVAHITPANPKMTTANAAASLPLQARLHDKAATRYKAPNAPMIVRMISKALSASLLCPVIFDFT